ncbi:plasmid replication DNA-binding protein [Acinetobacter soli]|uniref:plasmid replication DNA-binding protein n=2 Tax=Acinetobacter TaxID=469 RepID=UPI00124FB4BD|nr:plasmid replication DNA-binding protein [Acinetobacter soli]
MSRVSINKASIDFNVSRNTLYKHIKQGKLTKDSDGKLDTADLVRLYSDHVHAQQGSTIVNSQSSTTIEQLQKENEQLRAQLELNELRINELKAQIEYMKQNEQWLKQQLDQKLIETKSLERKGLLGRLFR